VSLPTDLSGLSLDQTDPTPLFVQLDRAVRAAIATGALRGGDRMPTVRSLAGDLGINPNTVAKTYGELRRAGLLIARRGAGTFVSDAPAATPSPAPRARERDLRPIVDRLLADALSLGVPFHEVLNYLHAIDARRSHHLPSAIES
jgi:DNA-binding transcriptional regulator YhcF (GntR family)